jgi:translation elongation factor EF-Ts
MSTITPEKVYALRNRCGGVGLLRCKRALEACGGDLDKAEDQLRREPMVPVMIRRKKP